MPPVESRMIYMNLQSACYRVCPAILALSARRRRQTRYLEMKKNDGRSWLASRLAPVGKQQRGRGTIFNAARKLPAHASANIVAPRALRSASYGCTPIEMRITAKPKPKVDVVWLPQGNRRHDRFSDPACICGGRGPPPMTVYSPDSCHVARSGLAAFISQESRWTGLITWPPTSIANLLLCRR